MGKRYLNLGCGGRFHADWINMDVASHDPCVIQVDLSRGIPLPDASCAVVYHAAVLEHFRPPDAFSFLRECRRVLTPGGILRIGVPDLERLCRLYLEKLAAAQAGDDDAARDYDWVILELFDQMVRERNGGEMLAWLRQDPLPNEAFVYARIGEEGRELVAGLRRGAAPEPQPVASPFVPRRLVGAVGRRIGRLPAAVKRRLLALLLGEQGLRALDIGRFRLGGEVHQWVYDPWSLARLVRSAGFSDPVPQGASTSLIPDWQRFYLDTRPDGTVIKPDLLFMEAQK
ncbi:methyltransferase domain-containing protein [uncultured Thiodictyon sp.]|jgi:predicted SAM-dependent methyltransferase|uniref:class I SAM-dependent methyltransferase n=1 Tax=uncultured Thiodictyon sp. TaxID=1846217 RepID=UPI0025D9238F|nr:methyltransferase domain-containing protein [uncultured Thiodictyon sp.]